MKQKILSFSILIILFCGSWTSGDGFKRTLYFSGYISDPDSIREGINKELTVYNLQPRERIADIGFNYGVLEGAMLLCCDSLDIIAEDILSPFRDHEIFDRVMEKFTSLRKTPDTNKLTIVTGNERSTTLPAKSFDKVIIRKTFHHFSNPDVMLTDISGIMIDDGKLFILEPDVDSSYFDKDCETTVFSRKDLLPVFKRNKFKIMQEIELDENKNDAAPWLGLKTIPFRIYILQKEL